MSKAKLEIEYASTGLAQVRKDADAAKQHLVKNAKDIGASHVELFNDRIRLEREWAAAAANRARELAQVEKVQAEARYNSYRKAEAEKLSVARAAAAQEKALLAESRRAEAAAAAQRKAEAREVERARVEAARNAAAQERAAQTQQNRGFRIGIGAVAGQGLSIGGIASINPAMAAVVAGGYAVKKISEDLVREATIWEKFKVALTDIEGSASKAKESTEALYELAKRPGIGLKEAEQTYIQFRALNMEGDKARKTIAAVSNAVALSGGGATEFQRVNYQITQMLSKGKVLEEDLRIMRNSLPRLTTAMRDAFGTTTAEGIRKAGYNAEQFLEAIVAKFEQLPRATQTLESAQENAATAMSRLKASLIPDAAVKEAVTWWTGGLEGVTKAVEILKSVATGEAVVGENNIFTKLYDKWLMLQDQVVEDPNRSEEDRKAYLSWRKGVDVYGVDKYKVRSSEMQMQTSYAAFMSTQPTAKNAIEADAAILLENQKLGIQLSKNTEYEKQRLTIAAEYAYKIAEAKTEEDKAALAKQRGLQLAILAKKQADEEAKALEKIVSQIDSQRIAAMDVSDYEKKRLEIGIRYELLMREATTSAQKQALEVAKGLELEANKREQNLAVAKELAATIKASDAAFEAATGVSWSKYANGPTTSREDGTGEISLTKSMIEGRKKAKDAEYRYAPDLEKLRLDHEKAREDILAATEAYGIRRNELLEQADREYIVKNAQFWADISSNMASSTSSMFSDFASVAKMKVDATYQKERESVMSNTKLTSEQREALLKNADDRREKQLAGTYSKMFKLSKAFAIADSLVQILNAQAKSANLPFPANLAAMATTLAATGSIVANIGAIKYAGQFAKGGDIPAGSFGIAGEIGPEIITGPAKVTSTSDTARLLSGSGEMKVVINNYSGSEVTTERMADGTLSILIEAAAASAEERIAGNISAGRGSVPKVLERTYGVRRGR